MTGKNSSRDERSFTVHDLPARERPRERLIRVGAGNLTLEEVLAIIISRGTRGRSVLEIARELVTRFHTIQGLADAQIEDLCEVMGIGPAKACQVKAAVELARRINETGESDIGRDMSTAEAVFKFMGPKLRGEQKECFCTLALDSRNRLLGDERVSVGTINSTMAHPREVFDKAIRVKAAGIVVVHNHPSGDPQPSDDDIRLTRRLAEAGKVVGIPLQDHVIVAGQNYYSFRARCLL